MDTIRYQDLTPEYQGLLNEAEKALTKAYAPYSEFHVAAALLAEDGVIIPGANFENASYGATICAERSAVMSANAQGHRAFRAIAVIARPSEGELTTPVTPCGICRQVLYEIAALNSTGNLDLVLSDSKKQTIFLSTIRDLLPHAFGPADLSIDIQKYK